MKDDGRIWTFGTVLLLGAAAAIAGQKRQKNRQGSRKTQYLRYRASGEGRISCSDGWSDEVTLDYPWDDEGDPPSDDDLREHAEEYFENQDLEHYMETCPWETTVEEVDFEPMYSVHRTLGGRFRIENDEE